MARVTRVVIIGGGPGGYEAALVAAQLGAEVTVVDRDGLGGSAVLTDCVPSKTLIATAEVMTVGRRERRARACGCAAAGDAPAGRATRSASTSAPSNARVTRARRRRSPPTSRAPGRGRGRRAGRRAPGGSTRALASWSTRPTAAPSGSTPTSCWSPPARTRGSLAGAEPDGERILTWKQVYDLRRAARAAGRRRLRRHRRRVRVRLPGARRPRSSWSRRATGCCPARTPTRRRCSRTSSAGAA